MIEARELMALLESLVKLQVEVYRNGSCSSIPSNYISQLGVGMFHSVNLISESSLLWCSVSTAVFWQDGCLTVARFPGGLPVRFFFFFFCFQVLSTSDLRLYFGETYEVKEYRLSNVTSSNFELLNSRNDFWHSVRASTFSYTYWRMCNSQCNSFCWF